MSDLVVRKPTDVAVSERALLEFESPSAALIAAPVRGPARGTVWVVTALAAAIVAASGLVPIDKVVTATGQTLSMTPTLVVQPLETSIVRAINVREGQVVHAGDVLARLDPTFTGADLSTLQAQVQRDSAEVERLQSEIDGKPYDPKLTNDATILQSMLYAQRQAQFTAQISSYEQKIRSAQSAATRAQTDIQQYQNELKVALSVEAMRKELQSDGNGSKLNSLEAENTRIEDTRLLASAVSQLNSAQHDMQAATDDRNAFIGQWRADASQKLHDAAADLGKAQDDLRKATLRRQLVDLRAAEDAVVLTVAKVSVGSVMQSGDQFITLVPLGAPLEVEAHVNARDAGFVHVGEPVSIKFDTFPFTHYGYAKGTVRLVSPDSFQLNSGPSSTRGSGVPTSPNASGSALAPEDTNIVYRVRVTLDQVDLHDLPRDFHLVPGMPITGDIKVGTRTPLTYIFSRVLPTFYDGMREP